MMLYLLDANVLITASNTYYPIGRVPEFWDWLRHQGENGNVKIPREIFEEVEAGRREDDLLLDWIKDVNIKDALFFYEEVVTTNVQHVVNTGYADDLTDDEMETLGRDPFLIAYALNRAGRCVVTTEVSKPSKQRHNRKIPDICYDLAVGCCDPFHMNHALDFRTDWNR